MDFPNPLAIASYLGPLTSWSNDQPSFDGIVSSHQPDVTTIARFCTQHFFLVCGDSPGQNVWCLDGCSHLIILPGKGPTLWVTRPSVDDSFKLPQPQNIGIKFMPSDLHIITSHLKSTPASPLFVYNVSIPSASLYVATTSSISAQDTIKPLIASRCFHTMEVPACIIDHVAPHLARGSSTGHNTILVLTSCSIYVGVC